MTLRHPAMAFAPSALVYPGGSVDAEDRALALSAGDLEGEQAALRVAAVREVFEECGVLLARRIGTDRDLSGSALRELVGRHAPAIAARSFDFATMMRQERLAVDARMLLRVAHWITTASSRKRFDTHFFIARCPPGQSAVHDGREAVDSLWITPAAAALAGREGRYAIMRPTERTLAGLAHFATVDEALARCRDMTVVTVAP